MTKSPYTDKVILTSKNSGKRTHKVRAFVIHHMAAKWTGEQCALYFRDTPSRQASANYCIGYNGDVVLNVEEDKRAWTSSSNWADQRALTYELGNSKTGHPWEVSDVTLKVLIKMLAEQHKRYGLKKASYTGDTSGTLWRHDWFAQTNCPGPYLGGKLSYIAKEVNKLMSGEKEVTPPSQSKPSKPQSGSTAGAKHIKDENAYFLTTENIKVRNAPSTSATHTGTLKKGNSINYFKVYEGNGYRWLQYENYNGEKRYLPYRKSGSGQKQWGTFHSKRPKSKTTTKKKFNLPSTTYWVKSPQFHGSGVEEVQKALASIHFYPEKGAKNNGVDRYYGPKTADAVRRYQSTKGLKEDGSYGPDTRRELDKDVNK